MFLHLSSCFFIFPFSTFYFVFLHFLHVFFVPFLFFETFFNFFLKKKLFFFMFLHFSSFFECFFFRFMFFCEKKKSVFIFHHVCSCFFIFFSVLDPLHPPQCFIFKKNFSSWFFMFLHFLQFSSFLFTFLHFSIFSFSGPPQALATTIVTATATTMLMPKREREERSRVPHRRASIESWDLKSHLKRPHCDCPPSHLACMCRIWFLNMWIDFKKPNRQRQRQRQRQRPNQRGKRGKDANTNPELGHAVTHGEPKPGVRGKIMENWSTTSEGFSTIQQVRIGETRA